MQKKVLIGVSLTLLLGINPHFSMTSKAATTCSTKEECNAIISQAQSQIADIKSQEDNLQGEIEVVEGNMGLTIQKIAEVEGAISEVEKKITRLESEIISSEAEVDKLEQDIIDLREVVAERIRVSQRLSRANTILQVLSESDSIVDFIRRLRVVNHFAESDAELMNQLSLLVSQQQALLSTLKVQNQELVVSMSDLETQRETLSMYQEVLEQQKAELAKQMQELESERLSAAEIMEIAEEQKKILEQAPPPSVSINSSSSSSSGVISSSGFMIPLASGYVSCEYMCYANHTGIDLANYGDTSTPVYAAQAGTVVRAGWHSAYGNHVIITHNINGQTLTTLYAHMYTAPYVSVGQQVAQGTQLGTMGSTGNSTGPHLHFEVYEGVYNYPHSVNPRKYVDFPSSW
ncbi:MAG: peptidoglycan DD-metalloendopeptidase family protein [Turicibacter sp.]|nr:peptidoglycan DD-metalloendopeptidase family protein [Turicibacter sp.]